MFFTALSEMVLPLQKRHTCCDSDAAMLDMIAFLQHITTAKSRCVENKYSQIVSQVEVGEVGGDVM